MERMREGVRQRESEREKEEERGEKQSMYSIVYECLTCLQCSIKDDQKNELFILFSLFFFSVRNNTVGNNMTRLEYKKDI